MNSTRVTAKGQITIPASVREALRISAGDFVEFFEVEAGRFEFIAATRSVTDLKGMFGKPVKTVTIDEMNAAIAAHGTLGAY